MARKPITHRVHGKSHINSSAQANKAAGKPNGGDNSGSSNSCSRWILFHGTSSARLKYILADNRLRMSGGAFEHAAPDERAETKVVVIPAVNPKFDVGMIVKFTRYRDYETGGMFTPGEEVYIHAIEEQEHSAIKGKMVKVYICTKASDAAAAKADPNLDIVEAEELAGSQLRAKTASTQTDLDPRDPMLAYVGGSAKDDPYLALTTERSVAEYWACLAVFADRHDRPQEDSNPVVLMLNGERLFELEYPLGQFDDEYLDDERDDVETGILCLQDIDPLTDVLIAVEHVTSEHYNHFIRDGREAVWHPAPPLARIELLVMSDTIDRFVDGDITPAQSDAVVSALGALRSAMSRVPEPERLQNGGMSTAPMKDGLPG